MIHFWYYQSWYLTNYFYRFRSSDLNKLVEYWTTKDYQLTYGLWMDIFCFPDSLTAIIMYTFVCLFDGLRLVQLVKCICMLLVVLVVSFNCKEYISLYSTRHENLKCITFLKGQWAMKSNKDGHGKQKEIVLTQCQRHYKNSSEMQKARRGSFLGLDLISWSNLNSSTPRTAA